MTPERTYQIASCNLPDAVPGTKDGLVSARSPIDMKRHGVTMYAHMHSLGVPMVSIIVGDGKVRSWPLSVVHNIEWFDMEAEEKPAKAKRGPTPDDAKP